MKCHLKKILVCSSCLQTLDMTTANLQGAPYSALLFVLKICTDTYKIIDKNIPLLTIRLGGKPCERLGGAGWLAGWGVGVRGCRGGGSLGSGATRTWPPPWPPQELPPPARQERQQSVSSAFNFYNFSSSVYPQLSAVLCCARKAYTPRWSWPLRSQSGFPRWPLPQDSSSCPPSSCRSLPFLSARVTEQIC